MGTRGHGGDLVDDFFGGFVGDFAEDRVVAAEPRGGGDGDEELGTVGAFAADGAPVGHGQQVGFGEGQFGRDFVVEFVSGAAGTVAERVASLDHESRDYAMEDHVFVQWLAGGRARVGICPLFFAFGEPHEVFHRVRGLELE